MAQGERALPVDFFRRVVPWPEPDGPGYINVHWKSENSAMHGMPGKPFKNLEDFMGFVQHAAQPKNAHFYTEIYFCLSSQSKTDYTKAGKVKAFRHFTNALALKSIWLDIDVKDNKGYDTLAEAMDAFAKFRADAALPPPSAIVKSGGGLHVYWISDKPLTVDQWRPFSDGLKFEALRLQLKCDVAVTGDAARVLRAPGTFNNKIKGQPRPVVLLHLGDEYNFSTDLATLAAKAPPRPARVERVVDVTAAVIPAAYDISGWGPLKTGFPDPMADNLAIGLRSSDLPLDPADVEEKCIHFADAKANHGKDHSQGLWALTILATTHMENGEQKAQEYSNGYPAYNQAEVAAKYEEKLAVSARTGWPGCKAFEAEGVKCQTCPFYGKIKSPLNLAQRVAPPAGTVQAPPPPVDIDLPAGYTLNPKRQICVISNKKVDGAYVETIDPLFLCELRNFVPQGGNRRFTFETSLDKTNWGIVSVDEELIGAEQELNKTLWRQGVKVNPTLKSKVPAFMASFLEKLDAAKKRINTISYGWLEEKDSPMPIGFAYGGKVYMSDGTTQPSGSSDQELDLYYKPTGSIAPWLEGLLLVTSQHHPALECVIAHAFAAPLMRFTGQYNGALAIWSPESGAHKTTSVNLGAAVWGSPQNTKEKSTTSSKFASLKFGLLRNLPIFFDEINDPKKLEEIRETLGPLTEGGEGGKLHANRTMYARTGWQTLFLVAANESLTGSILRHAQTDAQLQRVFEIQVQKRPDTRPFHEVSMLIGSLDHNYGHMGARYSEYLATHLPAVKKLVDDTMEKFSNIVQPDSRERFRAYMAVLIHVGAVLANRLGATFNTDEIWTYLLGEYVRSRAQIASADVISGTQSNAAGFLSAFVKASTRNVLWIRRLPAKRAGAPEMVSVLAGPNEMRPDPIHIRFSTSDRTMQISKGRFQEWLNYKEQAPRPIIDALTRYWGARDERATLSAGTRGVAGGPKEMILTIPIPPGSIFETDLFAASPPDELPKDYNPPDFVTGAVTEDVDRQVAKLAEKTSDLTKMMEQAAKDMEKIA